MPESALFGAGGDCQTGINPGGFYPRDLKKNPGVFSLSTS
jgi:hypothetical protein